MAIDFGIVKPGRTLYIPFDSFAGSTGASITLSGLAVTDIEIYKDGSVTQRSSDAGYTLLDTDGIDFDGLTGIHGFSINLADNTDAGFYAAGSRYFVVVSSVTVDSQTVSFVACTFSIGQPDAVLNTTIATLSTQTSFTLTVGPAEDDALNNCWLMIHDVASAVQMAIGIVSDYTGATKTVTLAAAPTFTIAATDNVAVMGPMPIQPTVAGRTLDVSSGGEAGLDWANVGSKTTTNDLSGTTIATTQKVDVETIKTNPVVNGGTITFPTTATLASTTNITAGTITTATNVTNVNGLAAGVITAASIAADAITDAKVAGDVTIASVTGAVGSVGAGGITAASIATGAIDADALSADAVSEIWTTALTESYNTDGAAPTPAQALFVIMQMLTELNFSGTTGTVKKLDGSTTAFTVTINSATTPTAVTRAT